MLNKIEPTETKRDFLEDENIMRKPYSKPQLEELSDLRTLTLGGSPGSGDSGVYPIPQTTQFPF
jgi:hypothetical protein